MKLIDACQRGLYLYDPTQGVRRPLDVVFPGGPRTMLLYADWWTRDAQLGVDFDILSAPLRWNGTHGTFEGTVTPGWTIGPPDDGTEERWLEQMRLRSDYARGDYLAVLMRFEMSEGVRPDRQEGFEIQPWIEAVLARPMRDPLQDHLAATTGLREVGVAVLRDSSGAAVDAIAMDDLSQRNAAVVDEDGWLAPLARGWETSTQTLLDYTAWLGKQGVYGPYQIASAHVTLERGTLQEIAFRAQVNSLGAQ